MNHFDIFGLAPSADLDVEALEAKHRKLAMESHPDRLGPAADAAARRVALERTTALNDALKVLKDPVRRAMYVLQLYGIDLEKRSMPMEFLENILELREELEHAKTARDFKAVRRMADEITSLSDAALGRAQLALRSLPQDLEVASAKLAEVKYYARFLEEVAAIEEESSP